MEHRTPAAPSLKLLFQLSAARLPAWGETQDPGSGCAGLFVSAQCEYIHCTQPPAGGGARGGGLNGPSSARCCPVASTNTPHKQKHNLIFYTSDQNSAETRVITWKYDICTAIKIFKSRIDANKLRIKHIKVLKLRVIVGKYMTRSPRHQTTCVITIYKSTLHHCSHSISDQH